MTVIRRGSPRVQRQVGIQHGLLLCSVRLAGSLLGLTLCASSPSWRSPQSPLKSSPEVLLGLPVGQFILVPFAPVPAEVLAGHLFGLLQGHRGLGVFQPGDGAGGLFQQVRTHGLFLVDQQHTVAAHIAPAAAG